MLKKNAVSKIILKKAGHAEVIGETLAKFELFYQGWNPYSRFLDIDKVDLILRRRKNSEIIFKEIQVKYGKLHEVGTKWEKKLFDFTSWRFFKASEFAEYVDRDNFYIVYILAPDSGYQGDLFIFPIKDFQRILKKSIAVQSKQNYDIVKVYISRLKKDNTKWYLRKNTRFGEINNKNVEDVSSYYRNFNLLE